MELASAIKLHEGGRARILAVATAKRIPNLPDIPTLDEAGVKGFESATWNAIAAPPKTPPAIVAKLSKAINEVLQGPGSAGSLRQDQPARRRRHARGGQGLHRERDAGVGRGDQRGARRAALSAPRDSIFKQPSNLSYPSPARGEGSRHASRMYATCAFHKPNSGKPEFGGGGWGRLHNHPAPALRADFPFQGRDKKAGARHRPYSLRRGIRRLPFSPLPSRGSGAPSGAPGLQ